MSGDIAVMYLYCACIVFEAKDPFYVRGHHQMRSFVFKRADLALIGFFRALQFGQTLVYFVQTSIHDGRQFQIMSNQ